MKRTTKFAIAGAAFLAVGALGTFVIAQTGHGFGPGHMGMGRMGMGPGGMGMGRSSATTAEMGEIHDLFTYHEHIKRTVTNLPDGIRTVTESDDPEMTKIIVSHVVGMGKRVEEGRDPRIPIQSATLQVLFKNREKIKSIYEPTPKGITVVQTSSDPETVAALQKHAAEVSELAKRGMAAAHEGMMRNMGGMTGNHEMDHGGQGHSMMSGRAR